MGTTSLSSHSPWQQLSYESCWMVQQLWMDVISIWVKFHFVSLVPRPNACACERVWYTSPNPWAHFRIWKRPMRSQSSVYWNNVVAKEFYYYSCTSVWVKRLYDAVGYNSLVCAVHFQDLLQQLEFLLIYTYCTNSHCWAIYFWKQDSQSRRRTSKHHWRACRSSTLYSV